MSRRLPLLVLLALSLVPSLAWGGDVTLVDWAKQRVEQGLVKPLREQYAKRSRYSRGTPHYAHELRVQIKQDGATLDKAGKGFVPFELQIKFEDEWVQDAEGCVYQGSGDIFVRSGNEYRPAAFLLGKNLAAVPGACAAAAKRS